MAWSNEISVNDERFHPRSDDPWWNESSFLTFRMPQRELFGMLYTYFRPNQNTAMGGPMFADPSGSEQSNCLYNGWDWHMPIPEGADMFDYTLANSFAVATIEPQVAYRFTYNSEVCEYDLTFTADRAPIAMESKKHNELYKDVNVGMADWVQVVPEDIKTGHFEQSGVMNGTLVIEGETIKVTDAAVIRDRTWGPRNIITPMRKLRGSYTFARANKENCFHAFAMGPRDWENDLAVGKADPIVSGWYVRDGKVGRIISGTRTVVERGNYLMPLREVVEAKDDLGRTLHAEAKHVCHLKWHAPYGDIMTFWCYLSWDFDGHVNAPGEDQDWFMTRHFRRLLRASGHLTER